MFKKIVLSSLVISALSATVQANDNDKIAGKITKKQAKDFVAGLSIGIAHGLTNRLLEKNKQDSCLTYVVTYLGAETLENTYNGNPLNGSTLWGRGIGQFFAESLTIDSQNNIKLNVHFNLSLIFAALLIPQNSRK